MCLLANTSDGAVHKNKSLICPPMKTKGVETRKLDKLGMCSSDTAQIFFDDARVPQRFLVGEEGKVSSIRCYSYRRSGCGPPPPG